LKPAFVPPVLSVFPILLLLALPAAAVEPYADLETGVAFAGSNDVRIPPDTGTDLSFTDDLKSDPAPFFRIRLGARLADRHQLGLLLAPLRIDASGIPGEEINFQGTVFGAGSPLDARYRFDSYRLAYLYRLKRWDAGEVDLGVTAKIRDAEIRLDAEGKRAWKKDTGFVPLLGLRVRWNPTRAFGLLLEADALASPTGEGRAEDLFLGATWRARPRLELRGGYRLLEGGADVESVYNFALIHYLSFGVRITLG